MLLIARTMHDLSFDKLMQVYEETNQRRGQKLVPYQSKERQRLAAEREFYDYLQDVFWHQKGAYYAVWIEREVYVSALRMERYQDGWLLSGLETIPAERQKGYAASLILSVLCLAEQDGYIRVYSHVKKNNRASLHLHSRCLFRIAQEYAVLIDGSVSSEYVTLVHEKIS